jgi:hypothetical protein
MNNLNDNMMPMSDLMNLRMQQWLSVGNHDGGTVGAACGRHHLIAE